MFASFFLLVGAFPLVRSGEPRWPALLCGAGFGIAALAWPAVLRRPNRWWQKFGAVLHRVTSPVALTLIYVVGILPAGLLMRGLGKDPLRLAARPGADSYWIERRPPLRADARMKRQF